MISNTRRAIAVFLTVLLTVLALPMAAFASEAEGVYEGEYDANGQRNGQGIWTFQNYRYEGAWENDMPNGEGVLYRGWIFEEDGSYGALTVQGNWADGFADGAVLETFYEGDSREHMSISYVFSIDLAKGFPVSDAFIAGLHYNKEMGSAAHVEMSAPKDRLVGGVPPWADAELGDAQVSPLQGSLELPSWDICEMIQQLADSEAASASMESAGMESMDDGTGVYEGDYDASGKRSGQGTWAYHNYLYAGNWENDMPSGEGTLYILEECQFDDGHTELREHMLRGNWVNGKADGALEITDSWPIYSGDPVMTFRVNDVKEGRITKDQFAAGVNTRRFTTFYKDYFLGGVPPWTYGIAEVNDAVGSPWYLYEKYPSGRVEHPPLTLENVGMSMSAGNLANGMGVTGYGYVSSQKMAALGDWVFIGTEKEDVTTLYKMRSDGSQMQKLYEGKDRLNEFQVIGDWLYAGSLYKIQADDIEFTKENEHLWIYGQVIDGWVYMNSYDAAYSLIMVNLDNTELKVLGKLPSYEEYECWNVIFADEEWVYLYFAQGNHDGKNELIKMKRDGSGEVERHPTGISDPGLLPIIGQIIDGRLYYSDFVGTGNHIRSVDLDFSESPVTIARPQANHNISTFHVTEDYIYYADAHYEDGNVGFGAPTSSIVRVDHNGDNPTVLAENFKESLNQILIAGDWMTFRMIKTYYLMRLDGSELQTLDSIKASKPEQETEPSDADSADAPAFPIAQGDKNVHVKAVQQRLIELGHLSGSADGAFGKMTKAAVTDFQANKGLPATGVVDEATYLALME